MVEAKSGLTHQLEAFTANTIEFMRRERAVLLDGFGVPDVEVDLRGRQVLIVAPGPGHATELARLKSYIGGVPAGAGRDRRPARTPCSAAGTASTSSSATPPRCLPRR